MSHYQPFPITEFKTGQYNYLQPWIRPIDAFEPLENAFIYRGQLSKRPGYRFFGRPRYKNNQIIATGNGGAGPYSGTLSDFPVQSGSTFTVTVLTSGGLEIFTGVANSTDDFTPAGGSLGDTFNVNYVTGVWKITFGGGRTVAANTPLVAGYIFIPTAETTPVLNPIMGLKVWISGNGTSYKLLALDTRRASVYNNTTFVFDPLSSVSQILWVGEAGVTTRTILTGWANIAPYSVSITDGVNTITDIGTTPTSNFQSGVPGNFVVGAGGTTITYSTGSITLVVTAANTRTYTVTFELQGNYFTGTTANFFNATNWHDPIQVVGGSGSLYLTNNIDRITLFDGTKLSRPPFPITNANNITFTNDILFCLDIDVYKNSLIVQRPFLVGATNVSGQSFRWSAINNPTNLVEDVSGNGGEASAPTQDFIASSEFLRDVLVVLFYNSTWLFRFTNNSFTPFRWDKVNNTKSTNAPYGTLPYDERVTAMGQKGLIACDGVNVQRYDLPIIDLFAQINQKYFAQCFGIRFDTTNQSWMTFVNSKNPAQTTSDQILVYNFLENSWAVYLLPMSCFGTFQNQENITWASFAVGQAYESTWEDADMTWDYYNFLTIAPLLLGGGFDGIVYTMNQGVQDDDYNSQDSVSSLVDIPCTITSTRWNPFIQTGQKVQFGWVDFYYSVNEDCDLTVSFFTDNSGNPIAPSQTVTLSADGTDGTAQSGFAMKRVYINAMGEFIQMQIESSSASGFQINGFILWCRAAGRLTP